MGYLNGKVFQPGTSAIEKDLAWSIQKQQPVQYRMLRWDEQAKLFSRELSAALQKTYDLRPEFIDSFHIIIKEIFINAIRESDFTLLMCFEYLELKAAQGQRPVQKPLVKTEDEFIHYLRANRNRPEFVALVTQFQKMQHDLLKWLNQNKDSRPTLKDLPDSLHNVYQVLKLRNQFLNDPIQVSVSVDLSYADLNITVRNKSFLDDNQVQRIMAHVSQNLTSIQEAEIDDTQGGAGFGKFLIQGALYGEAGLNAKTENIPLIYLPDKANHQVSVTLTLEENTLKALKK